MPSDNSLPMPTRLEGMFNHIEKRLKSTQLIDIKEIAKPSHEGN